MALGVDAVTTVQRAVEEYETDLLNHTARQAHALAISVAKLWLSFGDAGAAEVLGAANDVSPDVRAHWVNLRGLLTSTLELTDDEVGRLRQGLPVARLVGLRAPERAALPVQKLVEKAARMGKGDFERPLRLDTRDEFERLASALNDASRELGASRARLDGETRARLDAVDQVRRADRLISVGRIAAGLAHELGTPIHVAMERAKMARQGEVELADMPRTLDIIIEQTERTARAIRQVLDLARLEPPQRATADLRLLLDGARELLAPMALEKSIELVTSRPAPAPAPIDGGQIGRCSSTW